MKKKYLQNKIFLGQFIIECQGQLNVKDNWMSRSSSYISIKIKLKLVGAVCVRLIKFPWWIIHHELVKIHFLVTVQIHFVNEKIEIFIGLISLRQKRLNPDKKVLSKFYKLLKYNCCDVC